LVAQQLPRQGKVDGSLKGSEERRKADKLLHGQANSSSTAEEPRQHAHEEHEHQPGASPPTEAAEIARQNEGVAVQANGRKRKKQRMAPAGRVTTEKPPGKPVEPAPKQSTRQEALVRTAAHAGASYHTAAQHAAAAGQAQSEGQKSVRQADQRLR
jgi:hypothetical protein